MSATRSAVGRRWQRGGVDVTGSQARGDNRGQLADAKRSLAVSESSGAASTMRAECRTTCSAATNPRK